MMVTTLQNTFCRYMLPCRSDASPCCVQCLRCSRWWGFAYWLWPNSETQFELNHIQLLFKKKNFSPAFCVSPIVLYGLCFKLESFKHLAAHLQEIENVLRK